MCIAQSDAYSLVQNRKGKCITIAYKEFYHFEILPTLEFTEEYYVWLDEDFEKESPISDVILEFSFNTTDMPKLISIEQKNF